MKGKISKFLFEVVENESSSGFGKFLGGFIALLIVINVLAVAIETMPSMQNFSQYFLYFEIFSISVFVLEYIVRVLTAPYKEGFEEKGGRMRYVLSPFMVFDFFVIFPVLLGLLGFSFLDGRILRVVRILRIFRLQKYSASLRQIFRVIAIHKEILVSSFVLVLMGVMIFSTLIYQAENPVQPEIFSSIPAAMYWGVITMATIGYGDITPITEVGKFLAVLTALLGVAIYSLPTAILGAAFYAEAQSKEAKKILLLERKIERLQKKIDKNEEEEKDRLQKEEAKKLRAKASAQRSREKKLAEKKKNTNKKTEDKTVGKTEKAEKKRKKESEKKSRWGTIQKVLRIGKK